MVTADYVAQAGFEYLDSTDLLILASQVAKTDAGGHCLPKTPFKGWECSSVAGLGVLSYHAQRSGCNPQYHKRWKGQRERRKGKRKAEKTAMWVWCLPHKGENLRPDLQNARLYVPDTVLDICDPSTCTARWGLEERLFVCSSLAYAAARRDLVSSKDQCQRLPSDPHTCHDMGTLAETHISHISFFFKGKNQAIHGGLGLPSYHSVCRGRKILGESELHCETLVQNYDVYGRIMDYSLHHGGVSQSTLSAALLCTAGKPLWVLPSWGVKGSSPSTDVLLGDILRHED